MDELIWCSLDNSNYLAHYGVMGMKWGVRKSIRRLNSFSRHASRIDYKVKKTENKYNKLVTKYQKAKNKGLDDQASKYESKAWKQMGKLSGELYPKQKEALNTVLKGKEHVEKYLKTPLKVVKGKAVNKVVPYALGPVMGVHIQTIPYAKFKKDKVKIKSR